MIRVITCKISNFMTRFLFESFTFSARDSEALSSLVILKLFHHLACFVLFVWTGRIRRWFEFRFSSLRINSRWRFQTQLAWSRINSFVIWNLLDFRIHSWSLLVIEFVHDYHVNSLKLVLLINGYDNPFEELADLSFDLLAVTQFVRGSRTPFSSDCCCHTRRGMPRHYLSERHGCQDKLRTRLATRPLHSNSRLGSRSYLSFDCWSWSWI